MTATQAPAAPTAAFGFGLQNQTVPFFQPDAVQQQSTTLAQSTQTTVQYSNFMNTDVVQQWYFSPSLNLTAPTGTTNTVSPLGPFAAIQNIKVNVQNQFDVVNTSGVDLYIKEQLWPYLEKDQFGSQTPFSTAAYPAAASRLYGADAETVSATELVYDDLLPIGPAYHFDDYYHIDIASGATLSTNGIVSQRLWTGIQYLGGTNRSIFPTVVYNPLVGSNAQNGVWTVSGTQTAGASGTVEASFFRDGFFQNNPAYLPSSTNWVPTFVTYPILVGNDPTWVYQLPKALQILGVVFRFFDPASNAAPSASDISSLKLSVGSGLVRRQDTPLTMQRYLNAQRQRPAQLPPGTYAWDLVHDKAAHTTNRLAVNTFVTQGCQTEVKFSTPMSNQGMCYVSIFGLTYVELAGL